MTIPSLQGENITLRPLSAGDQALFYQWAASSDATPYIFGPGTNVPTWEELFNDYQPHYFDFEGSDPALGQAFGIEADGRLIGQVNYDEIDPLDNATELDIWIASSTDTGQGFGTDALRTLMRYLFGELQVDFCTIVPAASNTRAIRTYEKAGFELDREVVHHEVKWLHMVCRREAVLDGKA